MNYLKLKEKVIRAIEILNTNDPDLFTLNASEWAISHRLAVYLEQGIPGWDVDCEYNRQGVDKDPKAMPNSDKVRPDIILHHRGKVEPIHNLLVVEVKKHKTDVDLGKVCEYTKPPEGSRKYQYQFGLALLVGEEPSMNWFSAGQEIC